MRLLGQVIGHGIGNFFPMGKIAANCRGRRAKGGIILAEHLGHAHPRALVQAGQQVEVRALRGPLSRQRVEIGADQAVRGGIGKVLAQLSQKKIGRLCPSSM